VLGLYLVIVVGASVQGALIDLGVIDGFHAIGLALVGLAFLMGLNLMMGFAEQTRALRASAAELSAENERRRAAEAQIRERAYRDALTGLPNRLALQEHLALSLAIADAPSFGAVLQCNLDHFKVVNDALSHNVGDQLLREVARRIAETVTGRAMVARLGGDEFVAVLEGPIAPEEEAAQRVRVLAEDLSESFARPFTLGEQSLNLLASIGTATFCNDDTADEILRRVDMALHTAKRRGRNTIAVFSPEMQRKAEEKYRIVDGLRRAMPMAAWSAPRRCCAGAPRRWATCCPRRSSRSPRKPASSTRSATGRSPAAARASPHGPAMAWASMATSRST